MVVEVKFWTKNLHATKLVARRSATTFSGLLVAKWLTVVRGHNVKRV